MIIVISNLMQLKPIIIQEKYEPDRTLKPTVDKK